MTSVPEQLHRLPDEIQAQLWRIARLALGMSAVEKSQARQAFDGAALGLALGAVDDAMPGAEMLSALAIIIETAQDAANKEVV